VSAASTANDNATYGVALSFLKERKTFEAHHIPKFSFLK